MQKFEKWTVAYRRRQNGKTLLTDRSTPFTTIPNSWRYWAADPHPVENGSDTYVFAELYDRLLRRGVIGYCRLTDHGAEPWQIVLSLPHHLSYPHIFRQSGRFYMIPESYVANEVTLYQATDFPHGWERIAVLKSSFCAVDSTLFAHDGKQWLLTLQFLDGHERLMLFPYDNGISGGGFCAAEDDSNKRPAGYFFRQDGRLIRPAQDCSAGYGCALNFYEVTGVSESRFSETLITKIRPGDLQTDLPQPPAGLHTYNFSEHYEVIDLKGYEWDLLFHLTRPFWFILRRLKRLLKRN